MWGFYLSTAIMIVCWITVVVIMCSCFITWIYQLWIRRPRGIEETFTTRVQFDLSPSRTNIYQAKSNDELPGTENHKMEEMSTAPLNHMEYESSA